MIINHNHHRYVDKLRRTGNSRFNGAYYYSCEICKYIIPAVKTDRSWITVNVKGLGADHAIVFIHNNLHPENYDWLSRFNDLILVCGIPETVSKVKHLGKAIYLPLSVKVSEIEPYRAAERKGTAFAGRKTKRKGYSFPADTEFIEGLERRKFLSRLAQFENVYAVGRTAIEAMVLGCRILPYDDRFPDPDIWQIVDSSEAAKMLQTQIDIIDEVHYGV